MASRHSTGLYSLARNSCLNTSMPVKCVICGRGAEFPRASARRCLTFPHGVYSAHCFSSPTRCTGFTHSPPVDYDIAEAQYYHGELPTPPQFRFMVSVTVWPNFPLYGDEFEFEFVYFVIYSEFDTRLHVQVKHKVNIIWATFLSQTVCLLMT